MGKQAKIYETTREHETLISVAVAVFGFLVGSTGALFLLGSLTHGMLPVPVAQAARWIAGAEALIGIGLILRKELARRLFVALACAGMLYFGVELVKEHTGTGSQVAHISSRAVVAGEQGGPVRPPEEGGAALVGLVTLLIPAVFLTRPVVRRVFN